MQIETYSKLNQVMLTFFNDCFVLYKQQPQHSTFAEYKNSLNPQVFIDEFLKYFNNESVLSSDSGHPVSTTIFTKLFEEYWVSRAWAQNIAVSKDLYNSDEGYLLKALNKIVSTQDCKNLNPILEKFIVCLNLDMDPIPFSKILHTGEQTPIISLMEKHLGKTFASLINLNNIDVCKAVVKRITKEKDGKVYFKAPRITRLLSTERITGFSSVVKCALISAHI